MLNTVLTPARANESSSSVKSNRKLTNMVLTRVSVTIVIAVN